MTTLQAHALFAAVPADKRPKNAPLIPGAEEDLLFPVFMSALAQLSGFLPDCKTPSDLENAVIIGHSMLESHPTLGGNVISRQTWTDEAYRILAELMTWGDGVAAKMRAIAESN